MTTTTNPDHIEITISENADKRITLRRIYKDPTALVQFVIWNGNTAVLHEWLNPRQVADEFGLEICERMGIEVPDGTVARIKASA